MAETKECSKCKGTGIMFVKTFTSTYDVRCDKCGGTGRVSAEPIMQGIEDDSVRREMINGSPVQ